MQNNNAINATRSSQEVPVNIAPGAIFAGKVVKILPSAALVEIPGTGKCGLLHISEMFGDNEEERQAYKNTLFENVTRLENIEILHIDQLTSKSGQSEPRQQESIKLSVRRPARMSKLKTLTVEDTVEGRVVRKAEKDGQAYGLFVDVGGGVQGLLHESQLLGNSREDRQKRLASLRPRDKVKVGVRGFEVRGQREKLSLSESQAQISEIVAALESDMINGTITSGRVQRSVEGGLLVSVRGVWGFLPDAELGKAVKESIARPGSNTKVRVTGVARQGDGSIDLRLSRRGL